MTATEPVQRRLTADDPRLAPWRAFLEAHARVSRRLDEELRVEHDLSLGRVRSAACRSPRRPAAGSGCASSRTGSILSKSGVTRLIDRLVADGLVERSACLADARGAEAVLTEEGLARLRAASRTHLRGITEHFLDPLDGTDVAALEAAMRAISVSAGPGRRRRLRARTRPGRPISADGDGDAGGRLFVGTSGFAYPGWSPRFYPAGLRADGFLAHYASHGCPRSS